MTNVQTFADFTGQNIFVGLDVHKKSWNISVFFGNEFYKTFTQPPSPEALWKYLHKEFPGGRYYCCYESGFCGFWIQRELKQMDIDCIVVHAADVPRANKHKVNKTDQVDSKSLGQALSGGSIQGIYIPDNIQHISKSTHQPIRRSASRMLGTSASLQYQHISIPNARDFRFASASAHQHPECSGLSLRFSINPSTHQQISKSAHQPINSSAHQLISTSTHQPINTSTHQQISVKTFQSMHIVVTLPAFSKLHRS